MRENAPFDELASALNQGFDSVHMRLGVIEQTVDYVDELLADSLRILSRRIDYAIELIERDPATGSRRPKPLSTDSNAQ